MKAWNGPASGVSHVRSAPFADGFVRLAHAGIRPVKACSLGGFLGKRGLAVLFVLGDRSALRESADLAAVAPEITGLFGETPVTAGFTPPAEGADVAGRIGVLRLPAVALFLDGGLLGVVEGFREWAGYQEALSGILLGHAAGNGIVRRRIRIGDGGRRTERNDRMLHAVRAEAGERGNVHGLVGMGGMDGFLPEAARNGRRLPDRPEGA